MEQLDRPAAERPVDAVAGQRLPCRVEEQPASLGIGAEDHLAHILQHRRGEVARLLQFGGDGALRLEHDRHRQAEAGADREEQLQHIEFGAEPALDQMDRPVAKRGGDRGDDADIDNRHSSADPAEPPGVDEHHRHHQEQQREARLEEYADTGHRAEGEDQQPVAPFPRGQAATMAHGVGQDQQRRRQQQHPQPVAEHPGKRQFGGRRRAGGMQRQLGHRHRRGRPDQPADPRQPNEVADPPEIRPFPSLGHQPRYQPHLDRVGGGQPDRAQRRIIEQPVDQQIGNERAQDIKTRSRAWAGEQHRHHHPIGQPHRGNPAATLAEPYAGRGEQAE